MSKTKPFDKDSPEVAEFLTQKPDAPLDRLKLFKEALTKPDGPIPEVDEPETQVPSIVTPVVSPVAPQAPAPQADPVSVTLPEAEPKKAGRPLHGKKPKVEKTFAIDDEIHRRMVQISNHEGIRHDKKFSVSAIMNHLLAYALSHVDGTKVMTDDGLDGLVIKAEGAEQ